MADEIRPGLSQRSIYWLVAGLVFMAGCFLRLFRVGDQILLDDEWHALNVVQDHDYGWIFSHLGHADHSIPMALLYEFFSHSIGLSELSMRAPSLLAGMAAIVALPFIFRRWLTPVESLVMAALIALSPFLINFSRIARPYTLLALLAACAVIFAWQWWYAREEPAKSRLTGLAWGMCTVLAAWLNPVSLAVSTAPFLWFGFSALASFRSSGSIRPLIRLIALGLGISAVLVLLLYSPLTADLSSLAVKSGVHRVQLETFAELAALYAGSGHVLVIALMASATVFGWFVLRQRDQAFADYLLLITTASTLAVALTGAEWIFQGLVLARYLIGLLPLLLALTAIGLLGICQALANRMSLAESTAYSAVAVLLLLLFFSGPLPQLYGHRSQFMHHLSNQFDFDADRNPFRAVLQPVSPEPFYREIAQRHPQGDAVVVEAPWYLESHWNPLPLFQAAHQQEVLVGFVGGTCANRLYGELRQDIDGLEFRHFVTLRQVLDGETNARYLVLRKNRMEDARQIDMDFARCEAAARSALGEPWRETESALVFMLPADS